MGLAPMADWLRNCSRPLLLSHQRPDGDALGSLSAAALILSRRGATPIVGLFDPFPARYSFLQDGVDWRLWSESLLSACDALVIVDTCSRSQLEPAASALAAAPRTLVVDHHATRDAIGERPGDLQVIDASASATCLLLAEWALSAGVKPDLAIATALFTGIATDTGWFRFSNTDARTLLTAGLLVGAGVAVSELYATLYHTDSPERLRLIARMLATLDVRAGGQLAVMSLRVADFAATGATLSMTEDFINEATRLKDTEATILFTEQTDGPVRVNFRSKRRLDVADLARQFGGGGHARAAGARVSGSWEDVVRRVTAATEERLVDGR